MPRIQSDIKVTYRDIAKLLVKALPVTGEEFTETVENYITAIKALPTNAKIALRTAYIFSRKVPREEREDMYQDLVTAILKSQTTEPKLAYAIAKCDWVDWWRAYKRRSHYSLDTVVTGNDESTATVGELLVGEVEFERKLCGRLNAQEIYQQLPGAIRDVVTKRLVGDRLAKGERAMLERWANRNLHLMTSLQSA